MCSSYSKSILSLTLLTTFCLLNIGCGEEGKPDAISSSNGPVVRMWDEAGTEIALAGAEMTQAGTEMAQAGTEMAQAGTEMAQAGTEMAQAGTEMTQAGTEMAQAGTEMAQAGVETAFNSNLYITINEIVAQGDNEGPNWIEFANQSDQNIDLRGWVIEDDGQNTIMFAPDTIVPAQGYLRVIHGLDFMFSLDQNDQLTLTNALGEIVDSTQWTEALYSGRGSWARIPDMVGDFQHSNQATPNASNLPSTMEVDPEPVCGDQVCDPSENCQSCAMDCGTCLACPDSLFISEYVEGSQSNKAIELFNGTGTDIDLSEYQLWNIANGGFWAESMTELEGNLPTGETWVICHQNIEPSYAILCDEFFATDPVNFNGDDAIGLAQLQTDEFVLIDQIGTEGADIDRGWEVSGISFATQNHTLVRKGSAYASTEWMSASSQDWLVHEQDVMDFLGSHRVDNPSCY